MTDSSSGSVEGRMVLPPGFTPLPEPRLPPRVADHELLRRIGSGSYGEVWLARNVMGTYRAVKVVYRTGFEADRPFEREFAGIRRFEPISRLHESQVDILHVGRASDCFYCVMELADDAGELPPPGEVTGKQEDGNHQPPDASIVPERYVPKTLRTELQRRGKLPFEECVDTALALATALDHLHSHNLVHRDIKPSNIIFINGTPKLADIGLVTGLDATRSYVGTEGYIPPEGAGTPQADLYSLGKVLYEMGTGMDRQDFPEPPAFWEESTGESAWLEFHEVLLRACETDSRRRYQSAADLRADLEVLRAGKSVRRLRTVERRAAVLTRLGLAASLLLLVAAGAYLFSVHETHQAKMEAQRADREAARATRAEQQARERLFDSYLAQAQARRSSGWAGRRFDSLEAVKKAVAMGPHGESLIKLRNEAISCLALADFQTAKEWVGTPSNSVLATFDPALERFAYATDQGDVSICRVADGKELMHLPGDGVPANGGLDFSPDGQLLALFHGTEDLDFCVWQLERQAVLLKTTGVKGRCFDFSPDSHCLALVQHDGPILLYDLGSGQCTNGLEQGPLPYSVAFSPDGHQLAVSVGRLAQVRDLQAGTVVQCFPHPAVVRGLAWHENLLVTGSDDQKIRVWDTAEATLRCVLPGHQSAVASVAFNHRGDLLVSCGFDMTTRLWDALNWRIAVTKPGGGFISRVPFTSDDNWFGGAGGGTLGICNVAPGSECRQLWLDPKLTARTEALDFSHDGRYLVSAHNDGVRIRELATRKLMALLPETDVACVSFAPQGSFIFTGGAGGLKKWPIDAPQPRQFQPGPPVSFAAAPRWGARFSLTSDGRTLVINADDGLLVFDAATNQARLRIGHDANSYFYRCALSSDGQWLAGATLPQTFVRVWNLDHTNIFHDLKGRWGVSCLAFSRDGQRLITGSAYEYRSWDTQSWQCAFVAPRSAMVYNPCIAFAPDGHVMAVTDSAFTVRLLETATGRELATFGMPEPQFISCLAFSPDGNQLAVGGQTPAIYLWDLRLIRQQLAQMNLDWD
jgi:WD40 repeat protein